MMIVATRPMKSVETERPSAFPADGHLKCNQAAAWSLHEKELRRCLLFAWLRDRVNGVVPMTQKIRRNRAEGLAHRARLRALVLPGLRVGQRLPKGLWLASV